MWIAVPNSAQSQALLSTALLVAMAPVSVTDLCLWELFFILFTPAFPIFPFPVSYLVTALNPALPQYLMCTITFTASSGHELLRYPIPLKPYGLKFVSTPLIFTYCIICQEFPNEAPHAVILHLYHGFQIRSTFLHAQLWVCNVELDQQTATRHITQQTVPLL